MANFKPQTYLLQVHAAPEHAVEETHTPVHHDESVPAHHTEAAGHHGPEPFSTAWFNETNLVSFTLVALFLYIVFAKMGVIGKVAGAREKIARDIEAVEEQKQKAQRELDEIQKRVSNLNAEVDGIIADAKKSAGTLTEQILKDARAQAGKIVETAQARVELEQRAAARDLEKRLLTDALSDARADLARSLSASDQKRSVETFIKELSEIK